MKKTIKTIIKFALAFGIIYYLVSQGKLDFSLMQKALQAKLAWAVCAGFIVLQILCGTYRWKMLVEIKSASKLPFFEVLKTTWIGLFFSSVLPGAVTGDIVKLVYARNLDRSLDKTFLLTTILMDRVIGLIGLLFLLGLFSLISYSDIIHVAPPIEALLYFNFLLFIGVFVFLISLFLPTQIQDKILSLTDYIPLVGKHIHKTLQQVWLIGQAKKVVMLCFVLSMMAHFFGILAFWRLTSPFYDIAIPLRFAFAFMPLGLMAMAIPITPAGLGVGHAIFDTLFSYFGQKNGASLFNLYFITYVFLNLLGCIAYLTSSAQSKDLIEEAEVESEASS